MYTCAPGSALASHLDRLLIWLAEVLCHIIFSCVFTDCAPSGTIYGVILGFTGLACLYSCFTVQN
jgi:hypothetical protein